jgi:hypothetical protein
LGAQQKPLSNIERFLSLIRFDQRGKLKELPIEIENA